MTDLATFLKINFTITITKQNKQNKNGEMWSMLKDKRILLSLIYKQLLQIKERRSSMIEKISKGHTQIILKKDTIDKHK